MRISIIDVTKEELSACKKAAKEDERTLTAWARRALRVAAGLTADRDLRLETLHAKDIPNYSAVVSKMDVCAICKTKSTSARPRNPGSGYLYCDACWTRWTTGKEDTGEDIRDTDREFADPEADTPPIGTKPEYLKK